MKFLTASKIIPVVNTLKHKLENFASSIEIGKHFKKVLGKQLLR